MMPVSNDFVRIENLHFYRGRRAIFQGLDLTVRRGQITGIMGPSGTGKTTLLKLIGGQLMPDDGHVLIEDRHVDKLSRKELFALRARMGMLFQSGALFTDMSVLENVAFPLRAHTQHDEKKIRDIVASKLDAVGLKGTESYMPAELSGGMRRRIALARAIALNPELIMYDEPFAGQDPILKGVLVRLIRELRESLSLTTVIVSHDVQETLEISDYVYVLAEGKVQGQGTPQDIIKLEHPFVQQFLQGSVDGPVPFKFQAGAS